MLMLLLLLLKPHVPHCYNRYLWLILLYSSTALPLLFLCSSQVTVNGGGAERRLLLKSPVHTSRIKILLQLYPDAQFVFIHRDPYTVFKSAANMADTTWVLLSFYSQ